jgi:hypothetical protein
MTVAPHVPGFRNLVAARLFTWEYHAVSINPDTLHDRGTIAEGAMVQNQITINGVELNALGSQG